jgi:hypothetical protein
VRIRKWVFLIACVYLSVGCATTRTKYEPEGKRGGYSDKELDDKGIMVARFAGNAFTNSNDALALSEFRALEVCYERGFKVARMYGTQNLSAAQTIQRSSSDFSATGNRNYISGNGNSTTWNQTVHYPTFDTYFSCTNQAYMTKVKLKVISAEDMKPLVKDLMGALQVQDFLDDSPNRDLLQIGDFIIKVEGTRVQNMAAVINAIDRSKNKDGIALGIIRDGKSLTVSVKAVDGTSVLEKETKKLIFKACTNVPEIADRPICESGQQSMLGR